MLLNDPVDQGSQISRRAIDRDATGEARAGQIQHVINHPAHPMATQQHALGDLSGDFVGWSASAGSPPT